MPDRRSGTAENRAERTASIPLTGRARQYGYVIWSKKVEEDVRGLLGDRDVVDVVFDGDDLGNKRIDWKYRRISIGPSRTRRLSEGATLVLRVERPGCLIIKSTRATNSE